MNNLHKKIENLISTDITFIDIETNSIHDIESIMQQYAYEMNDPRYDNIFGWDGSFEYTFLKENNSIVLTGSLYYGNYKLTKIK